MEIDGFDPAVIADHTEGLTGSDLRMVLREAVLEALTEERTELTQDDLIAAVEDFEERDNLKNMDMIDGDGAALTGSADDHDHADHTHGGPDADEQSPETDDAETPPQ
jgi:hypothetical protein